MHTIAVEEIEKRCGDNIWGKLPGEEKERWVEAKEICKLNNFVIYGDPRGDSFLETPEVSGKTMEELVDWCGANGNCDFVTEIFLVVVNNEIKKTKTCIL